MHAAFRAGWNVRAWRRRPGGLWTLAAEVHNTGTDYALTSLAQWWCGSASNVAGSPASVPGPADTALGTGSGTPTSADTCMYNETYGTRAAITYGGVLSTGASIVTTSYTVGTVIGTFTEVGLWDQGVGAAAVGSSGVSSGAATLPLASGAPAVVGGSVAGQYNTAYINDSDNPEYVALAASANAGAASWTLQSALQHDHAAATPIVVFGGNLWAHAAFTPTSLSVAAGDVLVLQWFGTFTAVGP